MGNPSHYHTTRKKDDEKPTQPWNNWYHITIHVYGSWLRGDPRGWRSRHHREHVDGDYKNPPPKGKYDNLYELSKALMKRDPVKIQRELRQFESPKSCAKIESKFSSSPSTPSTFTSWRASPTTTPGTGSAEPRNTRRIRCVSKV